MDHHAGVIDGVGVIGLNAHAAQALCLAAHDRSLLVIATAITVAIAATDSVSATICVSTAVLQLAVGALAGLATAAGLPMKRVPEVA